MTIGSALAAADPAQRENCVTAFASLRRASRFKDAWLPRPVCRGRRLIANLGLKYRLTHRKLGLLEISNRKFFAILRSRSGNRFRLDFAAHHLSLVTVVAVLIGISPIRIPRNPLKP